MLPRDIGSIIKARGTWIEEHLGRVSGSEIEHFVRGKTISERTNNFE